MPIDQYLTKAEIIEINKNLPGKSGYSIINAGALDEAATAPSRVAFGTELNKLLGEKAAALVYPISQSHPFQDGNKRTAYEAFKAFLHKNGYEIIPGEEPKVQEFIGECAGHSPISKPALGARLQMLSQKIGTNFVR